MKLRFDLVELLTPEDLLEEVLANNHRYKAEPTFSKTGVGYLSPTTPEDAANELARTGALTRKLKARLEAKKLADRNK